MTATTESPTPTRRGSATGRRLRRVLPGPLHEPAIRGTFLRWLAVGAALRVVLLPVGISTDTLAVYWRAHVIAFHREVYDEYLVNMGAHVIHAAWLVVAQPFMGAADRLWTHPWWWEDSFGLAPQLFEEFLARPDAWRVISLLKLPYAAADLAAGLVLLALLWRGRSARNEDDVAGVRRAWIFWMLSPIALYATLIWGRYESFPVLAVLIALLLAERGATVWSALALGVGISLRTYPLLLVPVFALTLYRTAPRQLGWAGLAIAPFAATMALNRVVGGSVGELGRVGEQSYANNYFAFAFDSSGQYGGVVVLPAVLLAIGLYLLGRARGWWGPGPTPREHLWRWVSLTLFALFAFAPFSLHYLMWLTPAVALLLARGRPGGVVVLHLAQIAAASVALLVLFGGLLFTAPLGGLGPSARGLLPPTGLIGLATGERWADVAWTGFVVATLFLAWPLLRSSVPRATSPGAIGPRPTPTPTTAATRDPTGDATTRT